MVMGGRTQEGTRRFGLLLSRELTSDAGQNTPAAGSGRASKSRPGGSGGIAL